jgi:hypothetical protein
MYGCINVWACVCVGVGVYVYVDTHKCTCTLLLIGDANLQERHVRGNSRAT